MAFSDYLENTVLDFTFGKLWYSPQELWVGFSLDDPLDSEAGLVEPDSVDGYARVLTYPIDWTDSVFGEVLNLTAITFPVATGDWGLIKYFALFDSLQMIIHQELDPHRTVLTGQQPKISPFMLCIALD